MDNLRLPIIPHQHVEVQPGSFPQFYIYPKGQGKNQTSCLGPEVIGGLQELVIIPMVKCISSAPAYCPVCPVVASPVSQFLFWHGNLTKYGNLKDPQGFPAKQSWENCVTGLSTTIDFGNKIPSYVQGSF